LDIARRSDGSLWLAIAAQGLSEAAGGGTSERDFMKVYVVGL
jgi:hypothetical protein